MKHKGMNERNSRKCIRCGNHYWLVVRMCECVRVTCIDCTDDRRDQPTTTDER